jgi:glutamate mutase epsilon subunit
MFNQVTIKALKQKLTALKNAETKVVAIRDSIQETTEILKQQKQAKSLAIEQHVDAILNINTEAPAAPATTAFSSHQTLCSLKAREAAASQEVRQLRGLYRSQTCDLLREYIELQELAYAEQAETLRQTHDAIVAASDLIPGVTNAVEVNLRCDLQIPGTVKLGPLHVPKREMSFSRPFLTYGIAAGSLEQLTEEIKSAVVDAVGDFGLNPRDDRLVHITQ